MAIRFNCEQCQKTFRTQSGLNWHLEHIHHEPKSQTDSESLVAEATKPSEQESQKDYDQSISELKRELEDVLKARLDIFRERDTWLSGRIERCEKVIEKLHRDQGTGLLRIYDSDAEKLGFRAERG